MKFGEINLKGCLAVGCLILGSLMFGCKEEAQVDYSKMSIPQLEAKAETDLQAQLILADYYASGEKSDIDLTRAQSYWEKAAALGSSEAQYNLGELLYFGSTQDRVRTNPKAALDWYTQAAEQGHVDAMYKVGMLYEKGRGLKRDFHQAFTWYEQAAKQGHSDAQYALALLYQRGRGVRQDYELAINWYVQAAFNGQPEAAYALGSIFQRGRGVNKDLSRAKEYYGQACDYGLQKGCDAYRRLNQ